MKLTDFLQKTDLEKSVLIGYYGGGNYGDELLLEVLSNLLARQGVHDLTITYQQPESYASMHRDLGFRLIDIHDRRAVIVTALKSKNIIIGGGGLWGVDMNLNTLALSMFLFVSRWALRKKVYMLGVGYYNSTTWQGRLGAWLAGKASNVLIVRDTESAKNFGRITQHAHKDRDMAWHVPEIDPTPYMEDVAQLQERCPIGGKTLLVALRRPQSKRQQNQFLRYNKLIGWLIQMNPDRPIVLVMLESEAKDPAVYEQARKWRRNHKHLRIIEAPYNPLTLFLYIKQNHKRLGLIAPQLHLIMTAHLTGVPFLPITYDNKVWELLDQIGTPIDDRIALGNVTGEDMQDFANTFFGGIKR